MRHRIDSAAVTAAGGIGIVAASAAVISFSHVRALATEAGETQLAAWLLPVSIDGAIAAAAAVLLADSTAGRRPARLTWLLLGLGLLASLSANMASAEPTLTARAVAAWPPVALAMGIEVVAGLGRRAAGPVATPDSAVPAAAEPVGSTAPPVEKVADRAALALIRQLDSEAPGGRATRLSIQQRLGCGGSRAARLADLAREGA